MFRKVDVPILGLVNNMSVFQCPHCQGDTHVFGPSDGVKALCGDGKIDFLGDVPLHPNIGNDAHRGKPTVVSELGARGPGFFMQIARDIGAKIGLK